MSENTDRPYRSVTDLFSELIRHVTALFRKEIDLARAELGQNVRKGGAAIGLLVGAAILALVALNVLAAALVVAISGLGLDAGWSAIIVGGVLALIGLLMALKAQSDLRAASLAPTRTTQSLRRDAESVRQHARPPREDQTVEKETTHGA